MFVRKSILSLVLPFLINQVVGEIQLDVSSQSSIKSAAKTLAGSIISAYNEELKENSVPGLFDSDTFWWEAGTVWNALVGYSYLTGDSTYDETVSEALQWQVGENNAYMPANQTRSLGNDDQSSWGLAAMTAAEVGFPKPKNAEWVDYAVNVWNTQAARLDGKNGTCGGGLRWQIFSFNQGYDYKNSLSNGNFFLLSARLAKFTGNATYSHYADTVFKWSQDIGLVSNEYNVYDGADTLKNCSMVSKLRWSADNGIYTEGAALMYNITGAQNWTDAVKGLVNSSSVFQSADSPIIIETACETKGSCNTDMRAYKGIFARTYARAALAAPIVADAISKTLSASAKGAANACTGGNDTECKFSWADADSKWESASAKDGNLGEVYSALEVIQGLLYPFASKGLEAASGVSSTGANNTQNGGASGTSGSGAPQHTGAAGAVAVNGMAILGVALAATLNF